MKIFIDGEKNFEEDKCDLYLFSPNSYLFLRNNLRGNKIRRRCKLRVGGNEHWWADFAHIAAIITHANDYPEW